MPAYAIFDITVHDPEGYQEYARQSPGTIDRHGGRYLARGGATETREGDWEAGRLVILEFPDLESARRWHDSEEYRALRAIRDRASTARVVFTEGYAGA